MNRLLAILISGFLYSCDSQNVSIEKVNSKEVCDTITIIEKVTDTVYIEKITENPHLSSAWYIQERLPDWIIRSALLKGVHLDSNYIIENRMNPLYLEDDFNGDGYLDIALPIQEFKSQKVGFAIIHGHTNDIHIIGAGTKVKYGLSDNMTYIDIWRVNREKENQPGINAEGQIDENGPLILENPSMQVEKSEVGGGQIYWNGKEYVYFHQTC